MWHGHLLRILLKMRSKLSCFVKMIGNEYQSVPTDCFCQCSWNTVPIVWVFFTKWLLLWFMNAWFVIRALGVNNSWKRCYLRKERKMKQGRESWYTEQARCYILQRVGIHFFVDIFQDETKVKQNNHSKIHLHNQRGWWDCYGSACQSAFQIVSHSLWSIAWEGEKQKTGNGRLKTQDDAKTAVGKDCHF